MRRLMRGSWVYGFLGLGAATVHCGGEAIIDPPLGNGGASSSPSSSSSSSGASSSSVMTGPTTTTGPQTDCEVACSTIYECGVDEGRCPGFTGTPSDRDAFLEGPTGNDGCIATCDANPLLISLVDAGNCDTTINNLKSASADFADSCDDGI